MTFALADFWTRVECRRLSAAMDHGRASRAEIYAGGYRVDPQVRRAFDIDLDDTTIDAVQHSIEAARSRIAQFFDVVLSANEGPGFLRYTPGDFYRVHCDVAPGWDDEDFPRRISVVVFLSSAGEDCEGGHLRLYMPHAVDISPQAGTLVAFPSDVPHEVLPVTAGVRDAVVDWFY